MKLILPFILLFALPFNSQRFRPGWRISSRRHHGRHGHLSRSPSALGRRSVHAATLVNEWSRSAR
jgi:hypothetical protein